MPPRHPSSPPEFGFVYKPGEKVSVLRNGQWLFPFEPQDEAALKALQATSEDVAICSFPKSGTTWMNAIVYMVLHNGDAEAMHKGSTLDEKSPFLEQVWDAGGHGVDLINRLKGPRSFFTHLYYDNLPPSVQEKAKIIYVYRNPKDVIVSMYHFACSSVVNPYQGHMAKMADEFIEDDLPHAPYKLTFAYE